MRRKNIVRAAAALLLLASLPAAALADRFAVVKGGRLNLRKSPSTASYSLGKYDTGSWVLAGSESGGWYSVKTMDGKRGYMSAGYLDFGQYGGGATVKYANGGYVNLRSGPSTEASVVMRVTSGSTFYIQGDYSGWRYGYVYSGGAPVYGYMYETFLNTGTSVSTVTTRNGGKVNLRSGPGSSYASIGTLPSGTQVTVLLKGNGWYMVSANGVEGFMSTQYLSGTGSTLGNNTGTTSLTAWVNNPISTQILNLREAPSQSARSIGQYRNGTRVKVVKKGSSWCEVYVGTRHGYMMTRYLSFDGNYLEPSYPTTPSYPSYPSYPVYPSYTSVPSYPSVTPTPQVIYVTPTPQVIYITPKPATPKAGDIVTLTMGAGSSSGLIYVYNDAAMTSLKGTYPAGTQVTMLQYDTNTCMIYVDGGVAHVSTWYVNY